MPGELDALLEGLSDAERSTLIAAFGADHELARGLAIMLGGLPRGVTEPLMRWLGVHPWHSGLGEGAFIAALTDVIYERLEDEEREGGEAIRLRDRGLTGSQLDFGSSRAAEPRIPATPGPALAAPVRTHRRPASGRVVRSLRYPRTPRPTAGADARFAYLITVDGMGIER